MSQTASRSHGELKRGIASAVGSDPSRYSAATGKERHKSLLLAEYVGVAEALGLGFLADESKQQLRDSIMIKLGRDHRTGMTYLDTSDLQAIHEAVVSP